MAKKVLSVLNERDRALRQKWLEKLGKTFKWLFITCTGKRLRREGYSPKGFERF
jgi:hypothetical protein